MAAADIVHELADSDVPGKVPHAAAKALIQDYIKMRRCDNSTLRSFATALFAELANHRLGIALALGELPKLSDDDIAACREQLKALSKFCAPQMFACPAHAAITAACEVIKVGEKAAEEKVRRDKEAVEKTRCGENATRRRGCGEGGRRGAGTWRWEVRRRQIAAGGRCHW